MAKIEPENLLYSQPWLYEYLYPEDGSEMVAICRGVIDQFRPGGSLDVLDVGCGTGKVLGQLAELGHRCTGLDVSQAMTEYARKQHPEMRIEQGDMRTFDLREQFDVVLCLGSTFTYNLSNSDVHTTLDNFRKHCRDDAILLLGMLNASRFLSAEMFNERMEMRVEEGDFRATAVSRHLLDRRRQSFRRVRTWKIDGQDQPVVDDAEYRLFFPLEIEEYLSRHGFSLLGMWDNQELEVSDLIGRHLYVGARAMGSAEKVPV